MRSDSPQTLTDTPTHFSPQGTAYSFYDSHAAPNIKPTLVFIHGVGMNRAVWQPQTDFFSRYYRVLSYDILGHGDSPLPSPKPGMSDYTRQLAELLAHLKIRQAHIVGHSVGALIGVAFALEFEKETGAVVALNIVYKRDAAQSTAVHGRADAVLKNNRITGINETLNRWFENEPSSGSMIKLSNIRRWLEAADPLGYGRCYKLFASSDRIFEGKLDSLARPVLYMTGDKDPNSTPWMSEKMASNTPNASSFVFNNQAHMMAYLHPGKINPVIEQFLAGQPQETGE